MEKVSDMYLIIDTRLKYKMQAFRKINLRYKINLSRKLKNKKKNKCIVSGSLYIGIVV
jgi:hypothetical protein